MAANSHETLMPSQRAMRLQFQDSIDKFLRKNQISIGPIGGGKGLEERVRDLADSIAEMVREEAPDNTFRRDDVKELQTRTLKWSGHARIISTPGR